jgi:hypothetical protein
VLKLDIRQIKQILNSCFEIHEGQELLFNLGIAKLRQLHCYLGLLDKLGEQVKVD